MRLGLRSRILLLLLAVGLVPLLAFGALAVLRSAVTTSELQQRLTDGALARADAVLTDEVAMAEMEVAALASQPALAEAAADGDQPAAQAAFEGSALLSGWSIEVRGGSDPLSVTGATNVPPALDGVTDRAGVLVDGGRLLIAAGTPLSITIEGTEGLYLVAWRDATDDLLPRLAEAADGDVSVAVGDEQAGIAAGEGRLRAARSLVSAEGRPGELIVSLEPVDLGFGTFGVGSVLLLAVLTAVLLAVLLSGLFGGLIGRDLRALMEVAERVRGGDFSMPARVAGADELSRVAAAHERLARSLEERNRQITALASQVSAAPLSDDARTAARLVVDAARSVTNEPTWSLAVLDSTTADLLPSGVYSGAEDGAGPRALDDLHRWASVAQPEEAPSRSRYAIGPWGAFVIVDVLSSPDLRALLLAPWEGRPEPSAAERDLFSLLGQHAATAIEHALLYTRLRSQSAELHRLAAVQADFLRGITHDLQTPLTSIGALASELRATVDLPAGASADLDSITYQADRLRRMVSQLLTMSGLEAGAIQPRAEVFRVEPIVRRVWESLRPGDRHLEVEVRGPDRLAVGDPDRLEQVLWAILDNALKYSPVGTPVHVTLTCRTATPDDPRTATGHVEELCIADSGIGMQPETAARAFEQFYRADDARHLVPDGSGVGLFTAAGLVRLMGGRIGATSTVSEGTEICIVLGAEPTLDSVATVRPSAET